MGDIVKTFVLLLLLSATLCEKLGGAQAQTTHAAQDANIQHLIESLPPDSQYRDMLKRGARGDGVHHPWMDAMRTEDMRLAVFTFEFAWAEKGRELKDWEPVERRYFHDYDGSDPLTDSQQLGRIETTRLDRELEEAALSQAKSASWLEYPSEERGTGYRRVYLADNEWLPVSLSRFFGRYDPGTTPLMHAALLGDVGRISRLLSQGADINVVTPDGATALVYAATSNSPAAVKCLLNKGARLNEAGRNALVAAVATNHPQNVSLLLKAGADPNSRNVEGESVLSISSRQHFADIVSLLKQAGARQ
jgi:hypothetical protein